MNHFYVLRELVLNSWKRLVRLFPSLLSYLSSEITKMRQTLEGRQAELDLKEQQANMEWEQYDAMDSSDTLHLILVNVLNSN